MFLHDDAPFSSKLLCVNIKKMSFLQSEKYVALVNASFDLIFPWKKSTVELQFLW